MFDGHKCPARIACSGKVIGAFLPEDACNTVWAGELDLNISPLGMLDPNLDSNVLQILKVVIL